MKIYNKTINLYFNTTKSIKNSAETNLLWDGYSNEINNYPIIEYIEKNDNFLKNKYSEYIYEIKEKIINKNPYLKKLFLKYQFHIWWISKIEEKSYYKQPEIFECIKLLALNQMILY